MPSARRAELAKRCGEVDVGRVVLLIGISIVSRIFQAHTYELSAGTILNPLEIAETTYSPAGFHPLLL
jgi:hypothetical protein